MQIECICSERAVVVLGAVSQNADLHDAVRYIDSSCIRIDYPQFRSFGGIDFGVFFATVILLLLSMYKRHKPAPVNENPSIRPLTTNFRFAGHGAMLFCEIEGPKNNRLASYAHGKGN